MTYFEALLGPKTGLKRAPQKSSRRGHVGSLPGAPDGVMSGDVGDPFRSPNGYPPKGTVQPWAPGSGAVLGPSEWSNPCSCIERCASSTVLGGQHNPTPFAQPAPSPPPARPDSQGLCGLGSFLALGPLIGVLPRL